MKHSWKDKCVCGHSRNLHEHIYLGEIVKLEECNKCSCQKWNKFEELLGKDLK